jgi:hypothetical protein
MAISGSDILSRVRDTLQDTTSVRWTDAELLRYLNDGQREVVNMKPDASALTANVQLSTGTLQTIPSNGLRLIKITRNMSSAASDATGKRAIRIVDVDVINSLEPDWNDPTVTGDATHGAVVKHYIFDPDDPKKYYVYPGVSGNAYVEICYSKTPDDLSSTSSNLDIDDIYINAIVNYVLYRAYQKDAEYAGNAQRAGTHYQLFTNIVAVGGNAENAINPNIDTAKLKTVTNPQGV